MLLQFSRSHSVWWLYMQPVCRCYCRAGPQNMKWDWMSIPGSTQSRVVWECGSKDCD